MKKISIRHVLLLTVVGLTLGAVFVVSSVYSTTATTMFNQLGTPVRATLNVTFKQYMKPSDIAKMKPNESPDTAKYRTVHQGDSLWSFSSREYGQCEQWRVIAEANGIENPRLMDTGRMIKLPALK